MNYVENLVERYPELACCKEDVLAVVFAIVDCYKKGGKVLLCGNGGSAADCEHIAGELLKGFVSKRPLPNEKIEMLEKNIGRDMAMKLQGAVPAIPLPSIIGVLSAFANDVDPDLVYAQLVSAFAKPDDVLISISTSGNSKNALLASKVAKSLGIKTVALTGAAGGELSKVSDVSVRVPATETYKVQEYHLPVYHAICAEVERIIFS